MHRCSLLRKIHTLHNHRVGGFSWLKTRKLLAPGPRDEWAPIDEFEPTITVRSRGSHVLIPAKAILTDSSRSHLVRPSSHLPATCQLRCLLSPTRMTLPQREYPHRLLRVNSASKIDFLISIRWSYLETGVERIMRNLKEGVDMGTVCASSPWLSRRGMLITRTVHGHLHVSHPPVSVHPHLLTFMQRRPQLLHFAESGSESRWHHRDIFTSRRSAMSIVH